MYTIFFTINCVEQLTFSKTFVDQMQFEQLIFFCLKVELHEIHVRQMIFHDFWFLSNWQAKILLLERCRAIIKLCRADFSSNQISSRWSWPFIRTWFNKISKKPETSKSMNTPLGNIRGIVDKLIKLYFLKGWLLTVLINFWIGGIEQLCSKIN